MTWADSGLDIKMWLIVVTCVVTVVVEAGDEVVPEDLIANWSREWAVVSSGKEVVAPTLSGMTRN